MKRQTIALFGEAEKGAYCLPHACRSLDELEAQLGNPPKESQGLLFAIQALLFQHSLLFFRVEEEGFSREDYLAGLEKLRDADLPLAALALPGVGDAHIIDASMPVCLKNQGVLLIGEADFYDYLTSN